MQARKRHQGGLWLRRGLHAGLDRLSMVFVWPFRGEEDSRWMVVVGMYEGTY